MMRDIAEIGPMIVKFGSSSEQVMGDLAKTRSCNRFRDEANF